MASDAKKKKTVLNIVDTSIEIVNKGIFQVEDHNCHWDGLFCWTFLEQRENWFTWNGEPFNCSLKFAFVKNEGDRYDEANYGASRYYRNCNIKFQSYDQACFCKVKIEVRRLKDEPKESVVHTFELATQLASIGKMKEESGRFYYIPQSKKDIGKDFFEYRIEIVVKPFLMEKFVSLKIGEKTIGIPNIEKPAGLKLNGTRCDYEIVCQDKKFSCHKAVLATNINHFEVMFNAEGFEETEGNSMEIQDFSEKTVEDFLKYIYGENLDKSSFTKELLLIAEKYDVKKLLEDCQNTLAKSLNSENVFEILKAAFLANQTDLLTKSRNFMYKNPSTFVCDDWIQLGKSYPTLCQTLNKLK